MIFALVHATLGWGLASLAALALRNRAADARCWAWRLGLLKGPLALLLAIPVVVTGTLPSEGGQGGGAAALRTIPIADRAPRSAKIRTTNRPSQKGSASHGLEPSPTSADIAKSTPFWPPTPPVSAEVASPFVVRPPEKKVPSAPRLLSSVPFSFFPLPYLVGVALVLTVRLLRPRPRSAMPRVEGVVRPKVVIPPGLDPMAAAMAHAHEAAHVRRHDPRWSLVADLVCAALWFAPPVWLCARAMRAEAEAACDAAALRETGASRRAYARLLLAHMGPAPANALGGPARRLAKRILMLERKPLPLARPLAVGLVVLGLITLLPWRAVARTPAPIHNPPKRIGERFPFLVSLDEASLAMLEEPSVKARIGWTPAQDAKVEARESRMIAVWSGILNRSPRIAQGKSAREAGRLIRQERARTMERALREGGPLPWTPQRAELQSLALARIGSALWLDPQVSNRLRLTPEQRRAIMKKDAMVVDRAFDMDGRTDKAYLPLPKTVADASIGLQTRIYDALPKDRPALQTQLDALLRPYRNPAHHSTHIFRERLAKAQLQMAWRFLDKAQPELLMLLTTKQRETLQTLTEHPESWQEGSDRAMAFSASQSSAKPLKGFGAGLPPTRLPLHIAASMLLEEPGVKARIGWTDAQDAEMEKASERFQASLDVFRAEIVRRQKTGILRDALAWDSQHRGEAIDRAQEAYGPFPWTPVQEHTLKSLALARFGSAV